MIKYKGINKVLALIAIRKNADALQFVKNQTEELCEIAIKQNGLALQFVRNQSPTICEKAIKENVYALEYVLNENLFITLAKKINIKIDIK